MKSVLDATEGDLEKCWSMFHEKRDGLPLEILSFQSLLLKALTGAEQVYREIEQERRSLISRKSSLTAVWFKRRMAKLDHFTKCIKIALGTGRAIGDGFAWLLYLDDDKLIEEHLKLQRQPLLPPGAGGRGEKIFLENFQNTNGTLAVYHGITSFLRMGDFSFYDPEKRKIVGIGELKTQANADGSHCLHMRIIAQYGTKLSDPVKPKGQMRGTSLQNPLLPYHERRLIRQSEQILDAVKRAEKLSLGPAMSSSKKIDLTPLQSVLDAPGARRVKYELVGKGLLLAGIATPGSFSTRELSGSKQNMNSRLGALIPNAMKIMIPGATDNSLSVSFFGYSNDHQPLMMAGTTPLFWWPLSGQQKHDLIFGKVVVVSLYNAAHLFAMLRRHGYDITVGTKAHLVRATKKMPDGRKMSLENFSYFQNLAVQYLLSEDVIEDIVVLTERKTLEAMNGRSGRVQLRPKIIF